jgi:hypothetical protein
LTPERTEIEGFVSEYRYEPEDGNYDKIFYPVTGFFVVVEDDPYTMKLYDSIGRFLHPMNRVSIMRSVANALEGNIRFPRPFVFRYKNSAEKMSGKFPSTIVSHGDHVKISYIGGNIFKPLVEGSIESLAIQTQVPFLRTDPKNLERKAKRFENEDYTLEFEDDGKGNLTLEVTAKTEGNANITVKTTGKISIQSTGDTEVNATGDIKINGQNVNVNEGEKGAARQDDTIEATIPAGSFWISDNTPNPSPVNITGKITSSSAKVKIGG